MKRNHVAKFCIASFALIALYPIVVASMFAVGQVPEKTCPIPPGFFENYLVGVFLVTGAMQLGYAMHNYTAYYGLPFLYALMPGLSANFVHINRFDYHYYLLILSVTLAVDFLFFYRANPKLRWFFKLKFAFALILTFAIYLEFTKSPPSAVTFVYGKIKALAGVTCISPI